ncbi:MAG TPA: glycosyltransferase family 4 protein [Polyangiaceae bacterium]|nr:glycosyltransferase family 4 protein [Polyangiaceae bacterium]
MRIAVLTTSYPRSPGDPAGHFVQAETRALCRAGHDVWVIAPGEHGSVVTGSPNLVWLASGSAFGWPGVAARLRENPLRALGVAAYFAAAGRELYERGPFDRIVAHWLVPSGFPLALAAPGKGELEVVAHGSDVRLLLKAPRLARFALQRLLARGATLRCVSQELADALVRLEPRAAPSTRVEACALDVPPIERARARAELAAGDDPLLVYAARLVDGKRPEAALRSAALLPFARCVVIGDGPRRAALERQFPSAEFLGTVDRDVCLRWLAAADLVLSASTAEGAPSVVREARTLGTTVVARSAGDLGAWSESDDCLYVLAGESA